MLNIENGDEYQQQRKVQFTEYFVCLCSSCRPYVVHDDTQYNRGTVLMLYEEEALSHVEKEKNNIRCRILKDYS